MALNDDDYASLPAKILEQARRCSLSIQLFFNSVFKLLHWGRKPGRPLSPESTQKWMTIQFGPSGLNGVYQDLTHLDGQNQTDCIVFEIVSDQSLIIMEKIIINVLEIFMKSNKMMLRWVQPIREQFRLKILYLGTDARSNRITRNNNTWNRLHDDWLCFAWF